MASSSPLRGQNPSEVECSAGELMSIIDVSSKQYRSRLLERCGAFRRLNERRIDIDRRLMTQPPDDPARGMLWEELELVLMKLRHMAKKLAEAQVTQTAELSAKAAVLAVILRSGDADTGPVVPENTIRALALAVADDVVRLLG
jgi:hypothetical protein